MADLRDQINPFRRGFDLPDQAPLNARTSSEPDSLDLAIDQLEGDSKTRFRSSIRDAYTVNPDQYVEERKLSDASGLPVSVVSRNRDRVRRDIEMQGIDYDLLMQQNPKLVDWLSEPENAKVTRDDVEHLGIVGTAFQSMRNNMPDFIPNTYQSLYAGFVDVLGMSVSGTGAGMDSLMRLQRYGEEDGQRYTEMFDRATDVTLEAWGESLKRHADFADVPIEEKSLYTELMRGTGQVFGTVGMAATGIGLIGLMGMGVDIINERAKEKGVEKTPASDVAKLGGGVITGGTEKIISAAYLNRIPEAIKGPTLRSLSYVFKKMPDGAAKDGMRTVGRWLGLGVGEGIQEGSENILHDVDTKFFIDPDVEIGETALQEAGLGAGTGFIAGLVIDSIIPGRNRMMAENDYNAQMQVKEALQNSKTMQRDKSVMQGLIKKLIEDGEQNAYVNIDALNTFFQSQGVDPEQGVVDMGISPSEYNAAIISGSELSIPLETYMTEILTQDGSEELAQYVRLGIDRRSMAEVEELESQRAESIANLIEEMQAMGQETRNAEDSSWQVFDDLNGQLTGRMSDEEARVNATMGRVVAKALAARTDMTAWEFYQKNPVMFHNAVPQALQKQVDADLDPIIDDLLDSTSLTDEKVYGPNILAYFRSIGGLSEGAFEGELTGRDLHKQPGMVSRKGVSLEDALVIAQDEGYLSPEEFDKPPEYKVDALLDLIDRQLSGEYIYSDRNVDQKLLDRRMMIEALADDLDRQGIDYQRLPRETLKSILAGEEVELDGEVFNFAHRTEATRQAYENRIDELFAGDKGRYKGVKVLDRSDILDLLGFGGMSVHLVESAVGKRDKVTGKTKHPAMTAKMWKRVPDWIENPAAIFESATDDRRLTLIAPETVDGKPIVIVLQPNGRTGGIDTHVLVNAYEKDKPGRVPIRNWVKQKKLLYLDQKRSPEVRERSGLQLPGEVRELRGYKRIVLTEKDLIKYRADHKQRLFQAVWHGTPHTWQHDKASLEAIGTGEGAQAYGWGLYFASRREVAEYYRDALSEPDWSIRSDGEGISKSLQELLSRAYRDRKWRTGTADSRDAVSDVVDNLNESDPLYEEAQQVLRYPPLNPGGNLYQVDVPEDNELLAWDKSVDDQPEHIKEKLLKWRMENGASFSDGQGAYSEIVFHVRNSASQKVDEINTRLSELASEMDKHSIPGTYRKFKSKEGQGLAEEYDRLMVEKMSITDDVQNPQKAASGELMKMGIPGLRYLDAGSRNYQLNWKNDSVAGNYNELTARVAANYVDTANGNKKQAIERLKSDFESSGAEQYQDAANALENGDLVIEENSYNYVIWDEDKITVEAVNDELRQAQVYEQTGQLGQIQFGERDARGVRRFDVFRFQNANKSTMIHEMGHYVFQVLQDYALMPGADQSLVDDYRTMLKWFGDMHEDVTAEAREAVDNLYQVQELKEGEWYFDNPDGTRSQFDTEQEALEASRELKESLIEQVNDLDEDTIRRIADNYVTENSDLALLVKTVFHERAARGFEAYLMRGKAPTPELSGLFARIRGWMLEIYKALRNLRVELTPEVIEVFDRLVATQEEINAARDQVRMNPLFDTAERAGMTQDEFEQYLDEARLAQAEQENDLAREMLEPLRRETEKWWKKERKKVLQEVMDENQDNPLWVAFRFLRTGKIVGQEELDERLVDKHGKPLKLNRADLVDTYGERYVVDRLKGFYRNSGGISAEVMANLFGIDSGAKLVEYLANTQNIEERIEAEVDDRMHRMHGDILRDGTLGAKALESVMSARKESGFLMKEIAALERLSGRKGRSNQMAFIKEAAKEIIAKEQIRNLQPHKYIRAAEKAGNDAFRALQKGDNNEALAAKRRQLLNKELYRQARDALKQAESDRNRIMSMRSRTKRDRLAKAGMDYLEQVDGIHEDYEFTKVSNKRIRRRQSLRDWLAEKQADVEGLIERPGYANDPELGMDDVQLQNLHAEANTVNWRELTPDELHQVRNNVELIWKQAKLKTGMMHDQDKRDLDQRAEDASEAIEKNANRKVKKEILSSLSVNKLKRGVADFMAASRRVPTFIREMDGGKAGGVLWDLMIRPLNEATGRYTDMRQSHSKRLAEIYDLHYSKAEQKQLLKTNIPFAPLGINLNKDAVLSIFLNWGNRINRMRILDGYKLSESQVIQLFREHIDSRDVEFAEDVWSYVESYKADFFENHRKMFGVPPVEVEAEAFQIFLKDGSTRVVRGGYYPIIYDYSQSIVMSQRDLEQQGKRFESPTRRTRAGSSYERIDAPVRHPVKLSVMEVVNQHVSEIARHIAFDQPLMDVARLVKHDQVAEAIQDHYGKEVYDVINQMLVDIKWGVAPARGSFEKSMDYLRNGTSVAGMGFSVTTTALQPLGMSNSIAALRDAGEPAWTGWYWLMRGLAEIKSRPDAAQWAMDQDQFMKYRRINPNREIGDVMNRLRRRGVKSKIETAAFWQIAQSQFWAVDLPTWYAAYAKATDSGFEHDEAVQIAGQTVRDAQGGGELIDQTQFQRGGPLIRMFTNFISYMSATWSMEVSKVRSTNYKDPSDVLALAQDTLLLMTVPAAGSVMLDAMFDAIRGEDDDDDNFLIKLLREQILMLVGPFIGIREFGGVARGFYNYDGPVGLSAFGDLYQFAGQTMQGEADEAFFKSAIYAAGPTLHLPSVQLIRSMTGAKALYDDDTDNPMVLLTGPPKD